MNKTVFTLALAAAIAAPAQVQAPVSAPLFGGALTQFHLATPKFTPIAGLKDRVQDGQLHLRLNDFLALVLANGTQVRILQLNNANAQYNLLSAHSPFDPNLTVNYVNDRSVDAEASQINGAATLSNLSQDSSVNYTQTLASGQQVQLSFASDRASNNSGFDTLNPSIAADMNFSVTQSLLRNRGNLQNKTGILAAQVQLLVVGDQTETAVADQLVSAADQYWATVQARDQITVQQQALDLAQKSFEHDQLSLKLGAEAPGDILTSEAQVAADQVNLLQAQSTYQQQVDQLRRLIGADIDPGVRHTEISLDDDPTTALPEPPPQAVDDAVAAALLRRPEMDAAHRQLSADTMGLNQARDALRPSLNLTGSYGSSGLGGNTIPATNSLGISTPGVSGGFGSALNQLFAFGFPAYGFTLSLSLPVRNSSGEALLANDLVTQTSHQYAERNEAQQVTQDVRLADTQLRMAAAVVLSATTARDLAQKNVAAEQQKYDLGSITVFELLQQQVQLSGAQAILVNAYTSYQVALIAYERATWTLLDKLNLNFANR